MQCSNQKSLVLRKSIFVPGNQGINPYIAPYPSTYFAVVESTHGFHRRCCMNEGLAYNRWV